MRSVLRLVAFAFVFVIAAAVPAYAQVSLTTLGTPYTQSFDTLPASGSATWTNNSTIAGWFHARTGTGTTIVANNGSSNAGNLYSYGTGTATDRALGSVGSGNAAVGNLFWGVRLQNNTGATITSLDVSYTGEQWRNSAAAAQTVAFSYLVGSPTVTGSLAEFQSAGVAVASLDFTSPITGGAAAALDGNLAANRVTRTFSITGLSIPNGTEVMLRWSDPDHTGADHGLSIDDFSVTPQGIAPVTPALNINDVTLAESDPPGTTTFTFAVTLTAPAGPGGVTFDIATQDNTATTADNDYDLQSLTGQSIPAGSSGPYNFSVTVNRDTTPESNETFFVNITNITGANPGDVQGLGTINNDDVAITPIHDIQGPGASSPIVGSSVTTRGIVTGVKSNGFFIQEPDTSVDADPATSEGILVFTGGAPPAAALVGNYVQVTGTVAEFVPAADPLQPSLTELTSTTTVSLSSGNPIPAAIPLTPTFPDPAGVHDQLERLEGMRVWVDSLTVSGPTLGTIAEASATATSGGVFFGVVTPNARPFREPGIQQPDPAPSGSIPPIPRFDSNPEHIRVDSDGLVGGPIIDVGAGATVTGLVGPLDYTFRSYTILPDPLSTILVSGGPTTSSARAATPTEFTVASFNMQRFFDTTDDPATSDVALTAAAFDKRLGKASLAVRDALGMPDILGVVEMENLTTLQAVAARISADAVAALQPDPQYAAYLVEGHDIGGIDVGFLVKTSAVRVGVPRIEVVEVQQELSGTLFVNADSSTEFLNDRPPLRLNAIVNFSSGRSYPVTVIANHLRSLNGVSDPRPGTNGWPSTGERVRAKRYAQAVDLANLIQARQTGDPNENVIVLGDFNAYEFNDGLVDTMNTIIGAPPPNDQTVVPSDGIDLVSPDLELLFDVAAERYSYTYDGSAQSLDHIGINAALKASTATRSVAHARINADFPLTASNDGTTPNRLSDHDPVIAYFALPNLPPVNNLAAAADTTPEDTPRVFSLGNANAVSISDPDAGTADVQVDLAVTNGIVTLATTAGLTSFAGDGTAAISVIGPIAAINTALDGLVFAPLPNYNGAAAIQITTNDLGNTGAGGALTDTDVLTISVTAVNDAPLLTLPGPFTTPEVTPASLSGISVADIDSALGAVQLTLATTIGTLDVTGVPGVTVTGGGTATLILSGAVADVSACVATLVFTPPAAGATGTLTVTANDNGFTGAGGPLTASGTISITVTDVNDAPSVTVPPAQVTNEDTPIVFSTANLNRISVADPDAGASDVQVTITIVNGTATLATTAGLTSLSGNGTALISMTGPIAAINTALDGLQYTPAANSSAPGSITINVNDLGATGAGGPLTASGSVAITINGVNDAPVITVPGLQLHWEDAALFFRAANFNAITVADPDAGAASIVVTLTATHGILTPTPAPGVIVTGDGTPAITLTGPIAAINAALEWSRYLPDTDYVGPATIVITANDLGNSGAGGPLGDTKSVDIDLQAMNDAPNITAAPLTGTEDTTVAISGIGFSDVDGAMVEVHITTSFAVPLTVTTPGTTTVAGAGTANLTITGTPAAVTAAVNSIQFSPPAEFSGAATFEISANDLGNSGIGGVMWSYFNVPLTIAAVNDAPTVAVPGPQTTDEQTTLPIAGITVADIDADVNPINVTLSTTIGTLAIAPAPGVTVAGNGTAAITLDGPIAGLNATLATLSLVAPAAGGTGQITVAVNDLGFTGGTPLTATATIDITITDVNDAPTVTVPGAQTTNEGVDLVFATANGNAISIADIDAGAGDVQLTLTTTIGTMTLGSTAGLTSATGNGTAAITATGPLAALNAALQGLTVVVPALVGGTGTLTVTIDDLGLTGTPGALSATANVTITVNDVNDPPTITVPAAQTTAEGTNLVFATANGNAISVTDSDAAAGSIQLTLSTTAGTLALGSTAGLTVVGNGSAAITATGSIAALNAALQGLTLTVATDVALTGTITVTANDLGLTGTGGPQTATATIDVSVTDVNDAPALTVPAAQTTAEGTDLVFIAANGNSISVADVDAGTGAIRLTLTATNGTLAMGGTAGLAVTGDGSASVTVTGSLTAINTALQGLAYTYAGDTGGSATVTLLVDDLGLTGTGGPLTATASIAINVSDVNDAPVIAAPPAQTTPEDVDMVFSAADGNTITIADADAGTGELQITLTTTIGTLTLSSAAGVTTTGNGTAAVTATGTVAAINAALEGLTLGVPAATSGTGTLTIDVTDQGNTGTGGALTDTATVAITIDSINDPPVITISATTQDGTSGFVTFSVGRGNAITVSDPDANASPLEVTLTATCGTITLGSTAGLTFTAGDGSADATMTFTGTIAAINAAFEGMRFAVTPGCGPTGTLQISVNDLGATGNNGAQLANATIQINAAAAVLADVPALSFVGLLALGLALIAAAAFRLK